MQRYKTYPPVYRKP